MNLQRWLDERKLRQHKCSPQEISDLFRIVKRDLKDAALEQLSDDRRFATAYNAVLQLSTMVLNAAGYRTAGTGHHWMTFQCLPLVMGSGEQSRADYFDTCRRKRNIADYDASDEISSAEVQELYAEATRFQADVLDWFRENHKNMMPTR